MTNVNSMQMDPNGKMPPAIVVNRGIVDQILSGMMRARLFVREDASMGFNCRPMKPPTKTNGVATHVQIKKRYRIVKKLTAVAAWT